MCRPVLPLYEWDLVRRFTPILVLALVLETGMLESGLVVSIGPNQRFLRAFSANRFSYTYLGLASSP
jgi:hypothetical protein